MTKSEMLFYKNMKNQTYDGRELLKSFHLNGNNIRLCFGTQTGVGASWGILYVSRNYLWVLR